GSPAPPSSRRRWCCCWRRRGSSNARTCRRVEPSGHTDDRVDWNLWETAFHAGERIMTRRFRLPFSLLIVVSTVATLRAGEPTEERIKSAIEKGVKRLEVGAGNYIKN